jgi:hypothetical protein
MKACSKRRRCRVQVGCDVAKAHAAAQLGKRRREILIPKGQSFQTASATASAHRVLKSFAGTHFDQLRE